MAAEGEQCEGDQWFGSVEAERDAGEEPDLGVGRLDEGVGESGVECVIDRDTVFHDLAGEVGEGGHS